MFGSGSSSSSAPISASNGTLDQTQTQTQTQAGNATSSAPPQSTEANGAPSPPASTSTSPPSSGAPSLKDKRSSGISSNGRPSPDIAEKKRRSSSVSTKASALLASAKNSLHFSPSPHTFNVLAEDANMQTPLQKLGRQDPALSVPQGPYNNSAGESVPGPRSTFRVGVWEDKNKKCRRTMEDTHAFLYNFLYTPAPAIKSGSPAIKADKAKEPADAPTTSPTSSVAPAGPSTSEMMETDNGYFAIFDGHAGTFAADWCGKKLHLILEDTIRKNPNTPIPELLDQTFTNVDSQLEKLPLKNSGCTAVAAVLRWEDRIPNNQSATGSTAIAPATVAAVKAVEEALKAEEKAARKDADAAKGDQLTTDAAASVQPTCEAAQAKLKSMSTRQRVLYTANVGDARTVLCRNGKALRLSYDHKGSDENEGKRVANAGGLIVNNRVNGVLAVTRALGDAYMKDLVTGHPYTTETVIQPDMDEFIILACDGLWDVCSDQEAVDLVRNVQDPVTASKQLVDHALARFSTDNLSCMLVRLNKAALMDTFNNQSSSAIGVEGDPVGGPGRLSEADKIVADAKRKVEQEGVPGIGVSGSNSGKGHELKRHEEDKPTSMEKVVEEEPSLVEGDSREVAPSFAAPRAPSPRSRGIFSSKPALDEKTEGK